ncbi:unnamed protein product [Blumeria hordei]|uniref:Carboxylic ester hydrolase n=1 Tax=Blumeria hordei TaxID=2867405 RepID=A0A383UXX7_BLUHO|nr:unnamed protein product [Blumeria hordei]
MIGLLFTVFTTIALSSALPNNARSDPKASATLPIVDLQYALHQATINETGKYYQFSNIRYAAPPTGDLRFAAPAPPAVNRTLNDGHHNPICPQALPFWIQLTAEFLSGANSSKLQTVEEQVASLENSLTVESITSYKPVDPRTSEDCLFLDVIVPQSVYDEKKTVPVLVWIYGGGYVSGDKNSAGNPATLLATAKENSDGVVYVAMNYRLGLFGWLSGSSFASQNGLPNAALHDQRFALEWVQKNIHLFGGDPSRVTVIGESAGAGSIMHHMTAWGSTDDAPFQQAIIQSPGFPPISSDAQQEKIFNSVILQAQSLVSNNITTVADLKKVDFATLAALNTIVIARSGPYGTFTFGPVVDGTYVPKLPSQLFAEGKYARNLKVMTAHNSDEGLIFTYPLTTETFIANNLANLFPNASNDTLSYMINTVWPPTYDGSYPYKNVIQRATVAISELTFNCNARYAALAYPESSHSYYFTVPPGYHAADVAYTFYNGDDNTLNATVARTMQGYITNFAKSDGNPNGPGLPVFPMYGNDSSMLVISDTVLGSVQVDSAANDRCAWMQPAPYA